MNINQFLNTSYTSYHTVQNCERLLLDAGFTKINYYSPLNLERGKGYFFTINDSAIFAFKGGNELAFNIAEAHTDSPSLRVKGDKLIPSSEGKLANVERYGGGILYSFLDIPLKVAGRIFEKTEEGVHKRIVTSPYNANIPSLAIHHNPDVNNGVSLSVQRDMLPLLGDSDDLLKTLSDKEVVDYDLYVVPAVEPFLSGVNGEFLCSPRIDNLTSVYTQIQGIINCKPQGIALVCCFDNEEIGSGTRQGASSHLLNSILERLAEGYGFTQEQFNWSRYNSFIMSVDNAHATHQAHPEKSDPKNQVHLNKGIVIKHHQNYATDGLTSSILKGILDRANVEYQDYYNNSDIRCGSTIGLVTSALTGIKTVDVGIAQLAMHSAIETVGVKDIERMEMGVVALLNSLIITDGDNIVLK